MDSAAVPDSVKELLADANKFYREGAAYPALSKCPAGPRLGAVTSADRQSEP